MNSDTLLWLMITMVAAAGLGVVLGQIDTSNEEPPLFSTADERHPLADECIGQHNQSLVAHDHVGISISVNGESVSIPNGVGLNDRGCTMRPLHTHDSNGYIHIELKELAEVPLEAFFDTWGKHLDSTGFDEYRIDDTHEFLRYVNSEPSTDFQEYILKNGDQIEFIFQPIME